MNLKNFHKIHLSGIGGISMSALANILISKKHIITGSDDYTNPNLTKLSNIGIPISIGHNPEFIQNADLVVHSSAIPNTHPDLLLANTLNIPTMERATFLGFLASAYRHTIAVSGTHGKTTTTAMLHHIFDTAKLRPTTHVGGILRSTNTNYSLGSSKYFITEACEYNRSLLHLHPHTSIITNIEPEHMDCYQDFDDLMSTFHQFANQTSQLIIINGDNIDTKNFTPTKGQNLYTFGLNNTNTCYAQNIQSNAGKYIFDCIFMGKNLGQIRLNLFGKHNIYNALASICVALNYNIAFVDIQSAIASFSGVERRFDIIHNGDIQIIHDYAHHPTEITHAIDTALSINNGTLHTIFEPHTYSRTLTLMREFSTAFRNSHYLYILPTYPAREMPLLGGDAIDLFYNVLPHNKNITYCPHIQALFYTLDNIIQPQDTLLFLGAGDIHSTALQYAQHHFNNNPKS